jgi:hypothetical protein
MKKNLLNKALFIIFLLISSNFANAQSVIDFEDLTVPVTGYFNGSTLHSGTIGSTEVFEYSSFPGIFKVSYTLQNGYDYWSGTAYSNQTDLSTADWTNFSAYANYPDGGGANGSVNYGIGFMWNPNFVQPFSDTLRFELPTCSCSITPEGLYVTNSVWNYHYINGTDGSGAGKYIDGDYYKITFKGLNSYNKYTGTEVEFYLADFRDGKTDIISDWTWVDLTSIGETFGLEIVFSSSDDFTPSYYCIDNISDLYTDISENYVSNIEIYPNPASDYLNINNSLSSKISILDITGKTLLNIFSDVENIKLDVSDFKQGMYFIHIENEASNYSEKIIIL